MTIPMDEDFDDCDEDVAQQQLAVNKREDKRNGSFGMMPERLKKMARYLQELNEKEARGILLLKHDFGTVIWQVCENEARYGANAMRLLANYLGAKVEDLYSLIYFRKAFSREEVEGMALRRLSDGGRIKIDHLIAISRVPWKDRAGLLERVFNESLSVVQLRRVLGKSEADRAAQLGALRAARDAQSLGANPSAPASANEIQPKESP
jgi:hypothetical protein